MKYRIYLILLALFYFLFVWGNLYSQNIRGSRITGQIVEARSGDPIPGANVLLLGTIMGTAADRQGRFIIVSVSPGEYTIMVSAIGYKKEERRIQTVAGEEIHLVFRLEETVLLMDGIAVTANRYQQSLDKLSTSMDIIPAQEITNRNIVSADHVLRYAPGVNTLEGGQVTIRGSSGFNFGMGSRVLVLLNGNPVMTGDNWSINWYAISTSTIKQIEVMKGSGSALYGSSAMGGVINIITEVPENESHIHLRTFTGFYNHPSYKEWRWTDKRNHYEGTSLDISTHLGPISTLISSNYQTTTGYKENDDHQIFNFMTSLGYHFTPNLHFNLMTGYGRNRGGFFVYWKDLNHPYHNGSDPYGYRTRTTIKNTYIYPSLTYVMSQRFFLSVRGRINKGSTVDLKQSKNEKIRPAEEIFRSSSVNTQGVEIQANYQVNPQGILVVGSDLQADQVESIQYSHAEVMKKSYFMQFEQQLWDVFRATFGTRYDWESVRWKDTTEVAVGELSNKFGLNLTLSSGTHFRCSLGEGFRVPAVGERFVSTETGALLVFPNPALQSEKSISSEMGLIQYFSSAMMLDMAVFYTKYDNLIEPQLDVDSGQDVGVRFKNVVKARIRGFELTYRTDWQSQLFSTQFSYTYIDSKDLSPGVEYGAPLKYRSKHTIYLTNDLNFDPFQFGFDIRYLSQIERIDEYHKSYIKDIDKLVPTYAVALRLGYAREHFSLRFLVDNLFQYNYLVSPANMAPPRTGVFQLNIHY
ncbi:TonB-dependent receptor [bacterium]|nr:TonB-dependent receptor [bacterium]RQV93720.1 MAG: hypothetical protein EH221_08580 [bacterium]